MSTKVSRFLTLGFVFSIALVLVFSSSTHAVDLSLNVNRVWSNFVTNDIMWTYGNSQTANGVGWGASADGTVLHSINIQTMPGRTCTAGDIYEIQFSMYNLANNNTIDAVINGVSASTSNGWEFIQSKADSVGGSSAIWTIYLLQTTNNGSTCQSVSITSTLGSSYLITFQKDEGLRLNVINIYHPTSGTDMSTVNNAVGSINNGISDINLNLNNVSDQLDNLQRSQEQANDDANDRYQDEKDTISDNGTTAQNSANGLSFGGFSIGNPLLNWVALFTDNACVSIPTIASWIHSNETQVCSPWSTSVRSVMTPIIGVLGGTILFGFLVNWLKQKDGQELS